MQVGGPRPIVDEPFGHVETYEIKWREPNFNLAELAVLRWIKNKTIPELSERFGISENAVQCHIQKLRKLKFKVTGLSASDRKEIRLMEGHRIRRSPGQDGDSSERTA